jgi:hypothetical protein
MKRSYAAALQAAEKRAEAGVPNKPVVGLLGQNERGAMECGCHRAIAKRLWSQLMENLFSAARLAGHGTSPFAVADVELWNEESFLGRRKSAFDGFLTPATYGEISAPQDMGVGISSRPVTWRGTLAGVHRSQFPCQWRKTVEPERTVTHFRLACFCLILHSYSHSKKERGEWRGFL